MEISELVETNERTLLLISPQELQSFAENVANRILKATPIPAPAQAREKPLTQPEAIKFLGKSRQTFYSWRKKGLVIPYKIGGRIYYKASELENSLKKL